MPQTAALEIVSPNDVLKLAPGTPMGGGFFYGLLRQKGQLFALITAGIEGELRGKWGEYGVEIEGAKSFTDGRANTEAMAAAGSELAQQALALRIGGHADWAIPARDQQEPQYRTLKPTPQKNACWFLDGYNANSEPQGEKYIAEFPAQTAAEDFKESGKHAFAPGWYWSSTQYSAVYAFFQGFSGGEQLTDLKNNEARVRVVRMIPVSD